LFVLLLLQKIDSFSHIIILKIRQSLAEQL
jgi:hypothetical protein